MHLSELVPTADRLLAMEPDELGVHIIAAIADQPYGEIGYFVAATQSNRTAFPPETWGQVEEAIREAWAWLEGAAFLLTQPGQIGSGSFKVLSRRARQIVRERDPRRALAARSLPKDAIHKTIREDVWSLYQRGRYDTAVFEAMKAVEVAVRQAAGLPDSLLGVKLMRAAFAPVDTDKAGNRKSGPLTNPNADGGEQVGRMELFAGAIGSFKNPHSHRNVPLTDPAEAAEIVMLASHLLRIVDAGPSNAEE